MRQVVEEARPCVGLSEWTSDTATFLDRLDGIDGVESLVKKREEGFEESVFYLTGCIVLLQAWRGQVVLRVAGDRRGAAKIEIRLKQLLPEADERERVQLTFLYWSNVKGFANPSEAPSQGATLARDSWQLSVRDPGRA